MIAWHLRDLVAAEQILEPLHRDLPADAVAANLLAAFALVEQDGAQPNGSGDWNWPRSTPYSFRGSPEVNGTLVWALYRQGRVDQAFQKLRESISGARITADIAYFFARVLADKGQTNDARKLLERAAAVDRVRSPG